MTRSWGAEFGPHEVRVNAVAPGPVFTGTSPPREFLEQLGAATALGRVAEPAEIAEAIHFLVSPRANYITGALLRASDLTTYCPYKGDASYYSIISDRERGTDAVWFYDQPYPAVAEIKDHVAFYPDRVEIAVGAGDAVED